MNTAATFVIAARDGPGVRVESWMSGQQGGMYIQDLTWPTRYEPGGEYAHEACEAHEFDPGGAKLFVQRTLERSPAVRSFLPGQVQGWNPKCCRLRERNRIHVVRNDHLERNRIVRSTRSLEQGLHVRPTAGHKDGSLSPMDHGSVWGGDTGNSTAAC